jgi:carbamoyl-phosphate synthase small subunit
MNALLALEDGTWFQGVSAGAPGHTEGEVVFNTSMSGYQEILTDPSYAGQIVTMTAPQIGNYGVAETDVESGKPQVAGFIMRDPSPVSSNWRSQGTLRDYLTKNNIVAIGDIDTRALTRTLRSSGVMRGIIATGAVDPVALVERAKTIPTMEGSDLVKGVTCAAPYRWSDRSALSGDAEQREFGIAPQRTSARRLRVAAYDFGIKWNILRRLDAYGCDVHVFPASAPAEDLLAIDPDGLFLSNGPGDPAALPYAIDNVRRLVEAERPTFGICLGHQVLGLALGGRTFKLKFGHRGGNHPVKDLASGAVEITAQNHGFAVDPDSLPANVTVTHLNLYDGTVEGFRHTDKPIFSVQYHPEASPGPHDADYLFRQFLDSMETR